MTFKEQNIRYEQNLEGAYKASLEAKEIDTLELESSIAEIREDQGLFDRLADDFLNNAEDPEWDNGLLEWMSRRLIAERGK